MLFENLNDAYNPELKIKNLEELIAGIISRTLNQVTVELNEQFGRTKDHLKLKELKTQMLQDVKNNW